MAITTRFDFKVLNRQTALWKSGNNNATLRTVVDRWVGLVCASLIMKSPPFPSGASVRIHRGLFSLMPSLNYTRQTQFPLWSIKRGRKCRSSWLKYLDSSMSVNRAVGLSFGDSKRVGERGERKKMLNALSKINKNVNSFSVSSFLGSHYL